MNTKHLEIRYIILCMVYMYSGDVSRSSNPTFYRNPSLYGALMQSVTQPTPDGQQAYSFDIIFSKSVQAYIKVKMYFVLTYT